METQDPFYTPLSTAWTLGMHLLDEKSALFHMKWVSKAGHTYLGS